MYNDDKYRGINLRDIIIKVVFAIIFILIIIWLFPKTPNMKPFYSNVFRENISYMQDAAESYYTNDKLPKNVGDSVEMTLGEMIDKNIVLPFVDKDGKSCDTKASYVQVTKNAKDYTLLVNLVCPTEKNTLKKTLGCHDYCENCEKTAEKIENEFKKAVTTNQTVYSCPNGGTLSGTKCNVYSTSKLKATATTSADTYSCPNGGELKYNSKTNKYMCNITKNTSYDATYISEKTEYSCKLITDQLSGTTCIRTIESKPYTASSKTVGGGTYPAEEIKDEYDAFANNEPVYFPGQFTISYYNNTLKPLGYTCKTDFGPNNCKECGSGYSYYAYDCKSMKTTYSCPNGGTLDKTGRKCIKDSTYSCPNGGTLDKVTKTCVIKGTVQYSCSGTNKRVGTTCYPEDTVITYKAKTNTTGGYYVCKNNADTLNGKKCYVTSTSSYEATKTAGKTTYSCPSGYKLNDKECSLTKLTNTYNATASTKTTTKYQYKWSTEEAISGWTKTGKTRTV